MQRARPCAKAAPDFRSQSTCGAADACSRLWLAPPIDSIAAMRAMLAADGPSWEAALRSTVGAAAEAHALPRLPARPHVVFMDPMYAPTLSAGSASEGPHHHPGRRNKAAQRKEMVAARCAFGVEPHCGGRDAPSLSQGVGR